MKDANRILYFMCILSINAVDLVGIQKVLRVGMNKHYTLNEPLSVPKYFHLQASLRTSDLHPSS